MALSAAVQHADRDLAKAVSGFAWPNPHSMAKGDDSAKVRELIGGVLAKHEEAA